MKIFRDNGKNSLDTVLYVQSYLNVKFPKNYIDLVRKHDALKLEENIFDFINIYGGSDERDLNFLSFKLDHLDGDILSNQENINDIDNYGVEDLVIFGICANGDYICFDYRGIEGSTPKIVLVYHDDLIDHEDGSSSMVVNYVAESFDNFLNILRV
jgi:hypothetical protein